MIEFSFDRDERFDYYTNLIGHGEFFPREYGYISSISKDLNSFEDFNELNLLRGRHVPACYLNLNFFGAYIKPIVSLLNSIDATKCALGVVGDYVCIPDEPILSKSRVVGGGQVMLLNINQGRHWGGDVVRALNDSLEFNEKRSICVWRGGTSGVWQESPDQSARFVLYKLRKSLNPLFFNVGLSKVEFGPYFDQSLFVEGDDFFKGPLSIDEQLTYKYILVLEGNDVATSLKWVLASNSVPIMPAPIHESWLMEGRLVPWVHYAPVNSDLSNLSEVVDFLNKNKKLAAYIALNGRSFINLFSDSEFEIQLQQSVLRKYIDSYGC